MSGDSFFREEQIARSTERRHRENRGRLAVSWGTCVSTGVGVMEFPDEIEFECRYIRRPNFTAGMYFDADQWQAMHAPGTGLGEGFSQAWPMITPYVLDWTIDSSGLYTGAHVGARVDFTQTIQFNVDGTPFFYPPPPEQGDFRVEYCFRFEEVAIKGIGGDEEPGGGPRSG